jgi:hypothetical protein
LKSRELLLFSGHVVHKEETNPLRYLMGKPLEKGSFGRLTRRWKDLRQMGFQDGKWMELAQDHI